MQQTATGTPPSQGNEEPRFQLSYYVVAFLDLLGQSNELLKLKGLPHTKDEERETIEAIKRSAMKVQSVRGAFDSFIEVATKVTPERAAAIPAEFRDTIINLRTSRMRHRGFSDSFILTLPMVAEGEPFEGVAKAAHGIWTALFGICGISLVAMAQGIPMRGGIELGLGLDIFPNEVYGPSLVTAYELESKCAEYPRTLIGDKLMEYLSMPVQIPPDNRFGGYARRVIDDCRKLLCKAPDDGRMMLHILSPDFFTYSPEFKEFREPARSWVNREVERYRSAKDEKLGPRYERLAAYFRKYPD